MSKRDQLWKLGPEIIRLKEELDICKEAKLASEACEALCDYAEKEDEPFSMTAGPNAWHKSVGGGGGCVIL